MGCGPLRAGFWRPLPALAPSLLKVTGAGGAALAPVQTGSMLAAQEAASGAWLQELERAGGPPRALAPGLTRGVFGAWQRPGRHYLHPESCARASSRRWWPDCSRSLRQTMQGRQDGTAWGTVWSLYRQAAAWAVSHAIKPCDVALRGIGPPRRSLQHAACAGEACTDTHQLPLRPCCGPADEEEAQLPAAAVLQRIPGKSAELNSHGSQADLGAPRWSSSPPQGLPTGAQRQASPQRAAPAVPDLSRVRSHPSCWTVTHFWPDAIAACQAPSGALAALQALQA